MGIFDDILSAGALKAVGLALRKADGTIQAFLSGSPRGAAYVEAPPIAPSTPTALSDGAMLSASPVEYSLVRIYVDSGASGWVQLHDVAAIPANGEAAMRSAPVTGPDVIEFTGVKFATGAYWCLSSTMRTKTATVTNLCCAQVEV